MSIRELIMYACSVLLFVLSVSTRISASLTHTAVCQILGTEDGNFKIIGSITIEQRVLVPASKISLCNETRSYPYKTWMKCMK